VKGVANITLALALLATTAGAGVHEVGGPGVGGETFPFWACNTRYPEMRWQTIWYAEEIVEAGPVTKIEWPSYSRSYTEGGTFSGCKVLLCHTPNARVTSAFDWNYGPNTPVEVFEGVKVLPALPPNTWFTIVEPVNFTYNGRDHLLIEVSWVASKDGGTNYFQRAVSWEKKLPGRVWAGSATAPYGYYSLNFVRTARLTLDTEGVAATSLGRVKAVYR
jgi:hypothetical protein